MSQPSSTTQRLLEVLLELGNGHATGPQLAARMRVLPDAIPPYIAELRKLGYEVESDPHLGFRLGHCPDILLADELKARLGVVAAVPGRVAPAPDDGRHINRIIGRDVVVYKQTASTSDVIERLGLDGVEEGVVVFAEAQTKGRGRRGRSWVSPRGTGLWFSVLLRPNWPPQAVTRITILSAVALVEALEEVAGLTAQIKWPNDVLVNNRKLAGILTEMETDSDQVRFVTLGIGVNLHVMNFPPELREIATTVETERGQPVRRADLAVSVLLRLDALYAQALDGNFEPITRKWGARSSTLGKRVAIVVGSRRIEGQAMALDENGSLLVRTDNARTEQMIGGDVILEKA
jgi:BirA family biotin operon repressor/biotin-[acetyl-CoA-carboxylase] ligase